MRARLHCRLRDSAAVNRQGGLQGLQQALALAIRVVFAAQASTRIAGTGLHDLRKACGLAKGIAALEQAQRGGCAQVGATMDIAVLARHHLGQLRAGLGNTQALADVAQELNAAKFIADRARPWVGGCRAFAQVVHQAGKAYFQRRLRPCSCVKHPTQLDAGVDFRMVLCRLRHAPQCIHFGQQHRHCTAVAQERQHSRGLRLHQPFGNFLPNALGHQMLDFPRLHHVLQELQSYAGNREVRKARCKTRQTQYAHRVFAKCLGAMAQHTSSHIVGTAKRVDKRSRDKAAIGEQCIGGHRHSVDAEVAARQVFFQSHCGVGVDSKAPVARRGFALGARQGIFLFAAGM